MGVWAAGNFDNDYALDFVSEVAKPAEEEMSRPPTEAEDLELVMAAVAVRKVLVEHCHAHAPEAEELIKLKDAVLRVFDEQIDSLKPKADYKKKRRKIIEKTFDAFLAILKN